MRKIGHKGYFIPSIAIRIGSGVDSAQKETLNRFQHLVYQGLRKQPHRRSFSTFEGYNHGGDYAGNGGAAMMTDDEAKRLME